MWVFIKLVYIGVALIGDVRGLMVNVSVTYDGSQFTVQDGIDESADAYGYYELDVNGSGWNYLDANMKVC